MQTTMYTAKCRIYTSLNNSGYLLPQHTQPTILHGAWARASEEFPLLRHRMLDTTFPFVATRDPPSAIIIEILQSLSPPELPELRLLLPSLEGADHIIMPM